MGTKVRLNLLVALALCLCASAVKADNLYRLGPGDVVQITVWGYNDLTRRAAIAGNGMLSFPMIGKVKADGLTTDELADKLTALLGNGYIRDPQVSVTVTEYNSQRVYIHGEVRNPQNAPGTYILHSQTTLLELIANYGGTTGNADRVAIIVRKIPGSAKAEPGRGGETPKKPGGADKTAKPEAKDPAGAAKKEPAAGAAKPGPKPDDNDPAALAAMAGAGRENTRLIKVQLKDLLSGDPRFNLTLQNGDIVLIPRRTDDIRRVFVIGDAERIGPFPISEGLTLARLIPLVGVPIAETVHVSIYRAGRQDNEDLPSFTTREVVLENAAKDFDLTDGDFIYFKREQSTFYVVGEVRSPGGFYLKKGLTVREAIVMAGWITPAASIGRVKALRLVDGKWKENPIGLDDTVQEGDIISVPERWF